MTETAGNAGRIAACVDILVIAARPATATPERDPTVGAYEAAGVAGIHIEDQVARRSAGIWRQAGHPGGGDGGEVRAAVEAARSPTS